MQVTSVHMKLAEHRTGEASRLRAWADIVLDDCFRIHGLKVIEGEGGEFIQMPSQLHRHPCPRCRGSLEVMANFCSRCGAEMTPEWLDQWKGKRSLRTDLAHPVNSDMRRHVEDAVLAAYREKCQRAENGEAS